MQPKWLVVALWASLGMLGACSSDEAPPSCITVDTTCAPLYSPTFDNVYNMTIKDTCAASAACHSASGRQGGLSLATAQEAFDALRAGRVVPGDPGCSEVIVRTDSPGASYQMPPGDPMSAAERCALVQWVQAGAPGPGVSL